MKNIPLSSHAKALTELKTLRDMVRWGASQFNAAELYFGHGTDNAWDEALALALHAIHLPPDCHPEVINSRLTSVERTAIAELILRRVNERIPVPYLTHEAWFAGLNFYVDERVLIPRSPIAELIEQNFAPWLDSASDQPLKILDLCTGSGCIAVACAVAFPHAEITATDISADALAVARINAERHGVTERVRLVQSDLLTALKGERFDLIISNPPYVDAAEMAILPKEYQHEPRLGLAAGADGLDIVKKILADARAHLTDTGLLIVEVGNSEKALNAHLPTMPFLWLEFTRGGQGVFLLTAEQLND